MKKKILVVGTHEKIMEIVVRHLLKDETLEVKDALSEETVYETFGTFDPDVLMFSSGFDEALENEIKSKLLTQKPNLEVVMHYGGGTGLLFNEIQEMLDKIEKK